MAYQNGKVQAKRIARKLGEASFDLEMLRDGLFDMDFANVDEWSEMLEQLVDLRAEVAMACQLAQDTLAALQGDPPMASLPTEQVTNPFAAKNPQVVAPEKTAPKEKHKGG